jgi:hypothetical protein
MNGALSARALSDAGRRDGPGAWGGPVVAAQRRAVLRPGPGAVLRPRRERTGI